MRAILSLLVGLWLCVDCGLASSSASSSASSAATSEEGTSANLHLKLSEEAEAAAIEVNSYINSRCPSDDIFLGTMQQPHITLYLTEFLPNNVTCDASGSTSSVCADLGVIAPSLEAPPSLCEDDPVVLGALEVSGCYAMWEVVNSPCLQAMSDRVVNATYQLAVPNQTVPDWVEDLPEPTKSEKEALIKSFGSPNVFTQFAPHVTVGYDCSACVADALAGYTPPAVAPFVPTVLGMGTVGDYGTVVLGEDFADFPLGTAVELEMVPR